jgi:Family of unknown function (DUF5752)
MRPAIEAKATIRNPLPPFYFNASAHVLRITRQKATTISELLTALRECPDGSIFQHSFRTLQEHHFIPEGFSNDFAQWAQSACNEPALAEELASVDVREFTSLAELRERFVEIVNSFLLQNATAGARTARDAFYFCTSDIVVIPTNVVAHTLQDFVGSLNRVSVHSIHHHFIEARLRLKLMSNDFSQWLEDLGLMEAANQLNQIDIYTLTLEDARRRIIGIVEQTLG